MVISYHLQHQLEIDMEVGDSAPDFELEANDGTKVSLKSFAGQNNIVLCFYPKNHLFACPSKKVFDMAKGVISVYDEILATNSKLFAISIDTVESQKKFVEEYDIPYLHLSDTQKDTCKKYPGTNIAGLAKRATFIIDKNGTIKNIFRDIDVKNHGKEIVESLPDVLAQVSGSMRSGSTLNSAIETMVNESKGPVGQEFALLLKEQKMGISQQDALENLGERINSEDVDLVVTAALIARDVGGNLAETFERLSIMLRKKIEMEGKIKALTSQGKLQGWVVSMLPLFFKDTFMIPIALAGIFGACFAVVDVFSCPSGGFISDKFGRKNSLVILLAGAAIGFLGMSMITPEWPIAMAVAVMMFSSFFLGSAAGCVFAVVPLIKRRLTGQIAGMVGAYGNIGAVLFLTVFSFVEPSVFFLTISGGIAFAFVCSMFLDEPSGTMAEVMPDGTVQLIEVH